MNRYVHLKIPAAQLASLEIGIHAIQLDVEVRDDTPSVFGRLGIQLPAEQQPDQGALGYPQVELEEQAAMGSTMEPHSMEPQVLSHTVLPGGDTETVTDHPISEEELQDISAPIRKSSSMSS